MNSTCETLEDNQIKLVITIDEQEFDEAIEKAFRRIAKEVRLPGFRPGKAPRKVLEARLGVGAGRSEAIQDAVPEYYVKALIEHRVDVIDSPSFEVTEGQDEGALTFEAIVPVRPQIVISDYDSLEVEIPNPVATDEEIDRQIDAMREQFATLEEVQRTVQDGDQVTIDISGTYEG
ncbi:MAG: trigger factor, partial [Actinomycetota bacterium]|nr:trigger factor [Actinomycetota bacterium]